MNHRRMRGATVQLAVEKAEDEPFCLFLMHVCGYTMYENEGIQKWIRMSAC